MHVKLLGTGAAEGVPGLFCECRVCRDSKARAGRNIRTRSSAVLDAVFKIDLPPDTLHHVHTQGLNMAQMRYLLFTHAHDDHCAIRELQYLSWMFLPQPLPHKLQVYGPQQVLQRIDASLPVEELPLELHCLTAWKQKAIDDWYVTPIVAQHDAKQECFNYLITRATRTLLYATDTGWYSEEAWTFLARHKIDAVVVECTKGLDESGYQGHLAIPQVIRLKERLVASGALGEAATVVTTHHSHLSGLTHDELEPILASHAVQAGWDGYTFDLD